MSRAPLWRAVVACVLVVTASLLTFTMSPRLGLDLRGGTQLVFETRDSPMAKADAEATDRALDVLRRRADALGVVDPTLVRSGERRIIVELPGVLDPRQAAQVIGKTAQLAFHPVLGQATGDPSEQPEAGQGSGRTPEQPEAGQGSGRTSEQPEAGQTPSPRATGDGSKQSGADLVLADESGQRLRLGPAMVSGDGVTDAAAGSDPQMGPGWFVTVDFRDGAAWQELTGSAACQSPGDPRRRVAIVLDNEIISSPQVDPSVPCRTGIPGGSTQITGSFTHQEAQDLAVLIKGGALPVPLTLIEQRTVGPTLGAQAIEASALAGVAGVLVTALFVVMVYRLSGLLATVALAAYGLLSYAALLALGATLTLPGLAGFVLAIGMAVDANVLVFERAREEYGRAPRRGLRAALNGGFRNAWSAIADSNITTLLAAGLLFWLASGPVRGFGVTLAIGVIASLVSAMLITRVLTDIAFVRAGPRLSGIAAQGRVRAWIDRRKPRLMVRGRLWLAIAGTVVVASVAGLVTHGMNFGVEFTGGRIVEFAAAKPVTAETARQAVTEAGHQAAQVNTSGTLVSVRTGQISADDVVGIEQALERHAGEVTKQRDELIGPSLGEELRRNALIALGVALAAQLAYLAVRFRWTFGAAAVLALVVDTAAVAGLFAWLDKPVDGVFLAAMLTIIGYSINDKVVVFDRVRELWQARRQARLADVVDAAILQTVPRTVNTGLGALFILTALAVFGGDTLRDFAIALIVGIVVGTASSAFVAGPLAIRLERFSKQPPPRPPAPRERRRTREGSGAVV
ncbi:protein translocase subunit SecD [Nonomuraea phyllanthi]|uniref:Multifunctional fusion protein n=1 Tax=Nonomuraea phyllanthi TaxID=2219224 RepID=A0A5C4WBM2_9ACTN|nr:protein translocase subunit SecD [Nonomuraea phyllanthi]KAB8193051.1 protein translocase subunit SecD [Nonomuraea phyllanthi]QFY11087.1 protein translocase subunit SecD [Nonomuraea phyllanthi]